MLYLHRVGWYCDGVLTAWSPDGYAPTVFLHTCDTTGSDQGKTAPGHFWVWWRACSTPRPPLRLDDNRVTGWPARAHLQPDVRVSPHPAFQTPVLVPAPLPRSLAGFCGLFRNKSCLTSPRTRKSGYLPFPSSWWAFTVSRPLPLQTAFGYYATSVLLLTR